MTEAKTPNKVEEAQAIIAMETAAREKACSTEVNKVLDAHRCRFDITVILKADNTPNILVNVVTK